MSKPGRNDPCPCGSGKKSKFCHGALALLSAAAVRAPAAGPGPAPLSVPASPTAAPRQCGPCTACCEGWAEGEIRGHRMHPGQPCHFLQAPQGRDASSSPCTIYAERPQSPCRNFVCGWVAPNSPFPEAFRPDLIGVILVPTRWRDTPAWILLPAGRDPGPEMLDWMKPYARATGQPFYYAQAGERLGYGSTLFQQDMLGKLERGERLW